MRVLLDLTCLRTAQVGVRQYAEALRSSLLSLGGGVRLIQCAAPVPRYKARDSAPRRILRHLMLLSWYQLALPLLTAARRADVLICPEYYSPLLTRRPRIVVFYDTLFWDRPEYPAWWRATLMINAIIPAKSGASVVTISQSARTDVARLLRLDPSRISVAPIAVAARTAPNDAGTRLIRLGIQQDFLLHVGALERRKDIPRLINAFSQAKNAMPTTSLVLAGPPSPIRSLSDADRIERIVAEQGLRSQVLRTGFVSEQDLDALYANATALVFASQAEGFGIPLAEAMAAGLPIVAIRSRTTEEVVADAALLVEPGDDDGLARAMVSIVTNARLRADLSRRGLERAQAYSLSVFRTRLAEILARATGGPVP